MVECWWEDGECKAGCHGKGSHDEPYCFARNVDSLQISSRIRKRKRSTPNPPPAANANNWERGTMTDASGKPLLDSNLEPIGVKEYAGNRHKNEARIRELRNHPNPFGDPLLPRPDGTG